MEGAGAGKTVIVGAEWMKRQGVMEFGAKQGAETKDDVMRDKILE